MRIISALRRNVDWLDVLEDARPIAGVYGDERPALSGARVIHVVWDHHSDNPVVKLGIVLKQFPSNPPKKYQRNNAVEVEIWLGPVFDFYLEGVVDYSEGELSLRREGEQVVLECSYFSSHLRVRAEIATITAITSYVLDLSVAPRPKAGGWNCSPCSSEGVAKKSEMKELNDWYQNQCNGDWEHSYGVRIETLDNPGWMIKVDLSETEIEGKEYELSLALESDEEWLRVMSDGRVFQAACAPDLLTRAIREFLEFSRR